MTNQPNAAESEANGRRGISPATKLVLIVIPLMLIAGGWVFWQQIKQIPTREAGLNVSPYGIITVRLTTDPFPPPTGSPIKMTLMLQASGGQTINVDRVSYSYGPEGRGPVLEDEAQQVARNAYQGILQFNEPGDWKVTVKIENDNRASDVTITVPVK